MAKTIKEMADCLWPDNDELSCKQANAYMMGANAVLEEIEKELPKSDRILNDYGKALLWRINERIKELKG